jgi:hypothetical protein
MVMSEELKTLILQTYDSNRIKALAVEKGMTTLREDGIEKVLAGTTTLEEVLRLAAAARFPQDMIPNTPISMTGRRGLSVLR